MPSGPNSGSPNSESGMADGKWRVPHDDWPVRGELGTALTVTRKRPLLDEAASPRDGGSGLGGLCGLGGGWAPNESGVIPLDFRPLWLEFFGPHTRKGITMSELRNR